MDGKIYSQPSFKSSTSAKKVEQELFPSGNNIYLNTSTPMINPDAVNSQDKILSAAPMAQPKQEPLPNLIVYDNKENVGAKPDDMMKENDEQLQQQQQQRQHEKQNDEPPAQGVLRAPGMQRQTNDKHTRMYL